MLAKFSKDQRSIIMSSIKYLNSSFCDLKLCIKNKIIDQILKNIQLTQNLKYVLRI